MYLWYKAGFLQNQIEWNESLHEWNSRFMISIIIFSEVFPHLNQKYMHHRSLKTWQCWQKLFAEIFKKWEILRGFRDFQNFENFKNFEKIWNFWNRNFSVFFKFLARKIVGRKIPKNFLIDTIFQIILGVH